MEVKEAEKIVIAKPVPSRPTRSNFKSFSDLLTSAINSSPSSPCHEAPVMAIRPRTVRFKPAVNHALVGVVSPEVIIYTTFIQLFFLLVSTVLICCTFLFQSKLSGDVIHCKSEKILNTEKTSNVVYKPIAKLVSRTTISLLANMVSNHVCITKEKQLNTLVLSLLV